MGREGFDDRKEKNILEKGCWEQMLSFAFFGWLEIKKVRKSGQGRAVGLSLR